MGAKKLRCDGRWPGCTDVVEMIGSKGYAYCRPCGAWRNQAAGERVRLMTEFELKLLKSGRTLRRY